MSSPQFSTVLRALPDLEAAELRQVITKATAALSLSGEPVAASPAASGPEPLYDYLREGITHELRRQGRIGPRDSVWPVPSGYAAKAAKVRGLYDKLFPPGTSASEKAAFGQFCGRCLADYLAERVPVAVSGRMMLQQIDKMPDAIERFYPGYTAAGLLSWVAPWPTRKG